MFDMDNSTNSFLGVQRKRQKRETVIWTGDLIFKNVTTSVAGATTVKIPCIIRSKHAYIYTKSLIPSWPSNLSVKLIPIADYKTARRVQQNSFQPISLEATVGSDEVPFIKSVFNDHVAYAFYRTPENETRVMIINYYEGSMKRFLGLIPWDEKVFVDQLRRLDRLDYDEAQSKTVDERTKKSQQTDVPAAAAIATNECSVSIQQFYKVLNDRDKYRDKYLEVAKKYKETRNKNKKLKKNYDGLKEKKRKLNAGLKKLIDERKSLVFRATKTALKINEDRCKKTEEKLAELQVRDKEQTTKLQQSDRDIAILCDYVEKLECYLSNDVVVSIKSNLRRPAAATLKNEVKISDNLNENYTTEIICANNMQSYLQSGSPRMFRPLEWKMLYHANEPEVCVVNDDDGDDGESNYNTSGVEEEKEVEDEKESSGDESESENLVENNVDVVEEDENTKEEDEAMSSPSTTHSYYHCNETGLFKQQLDDMLSKMDSPVEQKTEAENNKTERKVDDSVQNFSLLDIQHLLTKSNNIDLGTQENIVKEIQRMMNEIKIQFEFSKLNATDVATTAMSTERVTAEELPNTEAEFENPHRSFEGDESSSSSSGSYSDFEKLEYPGSDVELNLRNESMPESVPKFVR